jgi:hypothetical protein
MRALCLQELILRVTAILGLALFLMSCSTLNVSGRMDFKNETYTSPNNEFIVDLPALVHPNAKDTVYPNQLFVDFFIGSGYWTPQGLHTIEWVTLPKEITTEQFQKVLPDIVNEHSQNRFRSTGEFNVIEQRNFPDFNSHKFLAKGTYQTVASTWICTIKLYKNRIAFISKVLPLENPKPITKLDENTDSYSQWVESFRVL